MFTNTYLARYLFILPLLLLTGIISNSAHGAELSELEAHPLRPPDLSSPRDTLRDFLEATEAAREGMRSNSREIVRVARRRAKASFDFSETTNGHTFDEQSRRVLYLTEILDRIALPPLEDIPGDAEVKARDVTSWTVPNTRLVIRRVETGERAGQFLFTALTVARLHRDYRRIRHLPYKPDITSGMLEQANATSDWMGTISARVRAELKPIDATSPRVVLTEFLRSVNEAHTIVIGADTAGLSGDEARDADKRAHRLIDRATRMLDLSQVPKALRNDVGTETVLLLKEVIDRAPLPTIAAVPGVRTLAKSDSPFVRWIFPNTEIEIVALPDSPGQFGFSAGTVGRAGEFYERVQQLPYRGDGGGPAENRFEEDYPNAGVSAGFYEYYIRTPGSLVPGASWLSRFVDKLPASMDRLFLHQTLWQWLTLGISLLLLTGLVVAVYVLVIKLSHHMGRARSEWLRLVAPLTAAFLVSRCTVFLDQTVNLTGAVNQAQLVIGTALVYLFIAFAAFRTIVAIIETLLSWLKRRGSDDEPEETDASGDDFDTSMMRLASNGFGFIAAVIIFVSGVRELGLDVVPLLAGLGFGGLAVALAIRPTLENMIGGVILYADRPIQLGDFCGFGDKKGVVESIGLRSTRIRARDRTLITVPNSAFADMQITNWAKCDKMQIRTVIGLRYETTPEQLRRVLARMRQICFAHPKIETDTLRIRFGAFGASSLDLNVRVYALVTDWNDFFAVREDLFLRFMEVIEDSGTSVAFPSTTVYLSEDSGLDPEKVAAAEQEVAGWREAGELPFPRTPEPLKQQITDSLDYPPKGSPEADNRDQVSKTVSSKNLPGGDKLS